MECCYSETGRDSGSSKCFWLKTGDFRIFGHICVKPGVSNAVSRAVTLVVDAGDTYKAV